MNDTIYDLAVIGGGAAGLMCAVTAAERGKRVALIEPNERLGWKLRLTGKGRCNLTNDCDVKTVLANIPGGGRFLYGALSRFTPADAMAWFEGRGLPLKTERGSRVFPVSDNANDVAELLARLCRKNGVEQLRTRALALALTEGAVSGVKTEAGLVRCAAAAVCTGGLSYPRTGSTGDGYRLAKSVGHRVTPTRPSLVPLVSPDTFCAELQGLTLKNVKLTAFEDNKAVFSEQGELLFTHFGVSGPLVLSASAHLPHAAEGRCRLELDLKPVLDEQTLDKRLLRDFEKFAARDFKNALDELLPRSMIPVLVRLSGVPEGTRAGELTREQRRAFLRLLKALPVAVSGTRPIDEAIVTAGGVDLTEIDPRSMQSKLIPGLYFAGEVLDLDAYTGGFNLQIAWSTGHLAGMSV